MPIVAFDHVNIKTSRLAELVHFYETVLGFTRGPRPNFPFDGAWLYLGGRPLVHLVEVDTPESRPQRSYGLEHFAFRGDDLDGFRALLTRAKIPFRERKLEEFSTIQLNFRDPDDNRLHVDFAGP